MGGGFIGWCYPVGWSVTSVKSRPGRYCTQLSRLHASEGCDDPRIRHSLVIQVSVGSTVDGSEIRRSPVELGSSPHYLQGLIHPWWSRISSINSIIFKVVSKQIPTSPQVGIQREEERWFLQFIGGTFIYRVLTNTKKKLDAYGNKGLYSCTGTLKKSMNQNNPSKLSMNQIAMRRILDQQIHLWNISKRQHTGTIMGNIPSRAFFSGIRTADQRFVRQFLHLKEFSDGNIPTCNLKIGGVGLPIALALKLEGSRAKKRKRLSHFQMLFLVSLRVTVCW